MTVGQATPEFKIFGQIFSPAPSQEALDK